ncbi:MAG TPA: hypothetical protein VK338_01235, partial [Candidatus Nitrosocosmicus sp.]|nr:hypothetical protein [Candidatus Nitrosocosmicus sp.]
NAFFVRNNNNPVLTGNYTYESGGVAFSSTLKIDNEYRMYYSGLNGSMFTINLATSTDGIHWNKNVNNPLIVPDTNNSFICEKSIYGPEVIFDKEESLYKMWYTADCDPKSTGQPRGWIKYAYSPNGISWTSLQQPVVSPSFTWDKELVSHPTVIKVNNKYKMWFNGRDSSGKYSIGYGESDNGVNWQIKVDPVITADKSWEYYSVAAPDITFNKDLFSLYYHTDNGGGPVSIVFATSKDGIIWNKPDDNPLLSSNVLESLINSPDLSNNLIYYSNLHNNKWQISLAIENIPQPKIKYVIIPGLFGSWNKEAILHNQNIGSWKLNSAVSEYNGLINTLKNIGLKENEDFYLYAYDWRASLDESANKLKYFIDNITTEDNTKVDIIGHSLGGLVGRIYTQKYENAKVDKLITVGSPHKGTAKVYKPVSAGEIDKDNTLLWLSEKFILQLNRKGFQSDRDTLSSLMPVLRDLLPTDNFLSLNNSLIDVNNMKIKNTTLLNYNSSVSSIFPILTTMYGDAGNTLSGYDVSLPNALDNLLQNYQDGRPVNNLYLNGDYVVLSNSAKLDNDWIMFQLNHGEIIYKKSAIKEILNKLNITYTEDQIIEGRSTVISPALIFTIQSPAEIEVFHNGITYPEKDGLIFIENAPEGTYELRAKGIEKGKYTIITGKIFQDKDEWNEIHGEITNDNPTSEIDSYEIIYSSVTPTLSPIPTLINYSPTPIVKQSRAIEAINNNINRFESNSKKIQTKVI